MKCKIRVLHILQSVIVGIALFSVISPYSAPYGVFGISYAKAPERGLIEPYIENNEVLGWKYYLRNELLKKGFTDRDYQILSSIASCESGWRQYDQKGNILSGYLHPPDKGIFQINTAVHDLPYKNPYDNIDSAIYLYGQRGTADWVCKPNLNN